MTADECYKILGIPNNSNIEEIKRAYRNLVLKYHPDKNLDNKVWATEKVKKINEAYEMLTKQKPAIEHPDSLWDAFFGYRPPFGVKIDPFASLNFNSKIIRSSVVLEVDESNNKDLDLIPETLRKAGFMIKSFTITRYH